MRQGSTGLLWVRSFFKDWGAMAGAGHRIGALARLSDEKLALAGYDRASLIWQVYRKCGVEMTGAPVPVDTLEPLESADKCLLVAREELQTARALLRQEIAEYPRPIAGCDAQFNHLLAQRGQVAAALNALTFESVGA